MHASGSPGIYTWVITRLTDQNIHMFGHWLPAPPAHLRSAASWPARVHPWRRRRCSSWRCWGGCTGSSLESLSVVMRKDGASASFLYNPLLNAAPPWFNKTSQRAHSKTSTNTQMGMGGVHIYWTHQQFIHAGLAFFQVYSLYGDTLLSGDAEGRLHHSRGPAAWNHNHNTAMTQSDGKEEDARSWRRAPRSIAAQPCSPAFAVGRKQSPSAHVRASPDAACCLFGSLQIRRRGSCKVVPTEELWRVTDGWTAVSSR